MASAAPLIVIAGPTGSGKTALALEWARGRSAEIVSADSQQIYRGFDLGTAKPTAVELAEVPHHLISVVDPTERFSAAEYVRRADRAIAEIRVRGNEPLLVGGTGLYIRALLRGVMSAPEANAELRSQLEAEATAEGWPALHARLARIDPESARTIQPHDRVRLVRALELHALTGTPASTLRAQHAFAEDRHPHVLHVLSPPRETLYAAIEARTRAIFAAGLVEETRALLARGFAETSPMASVGYRQARAVVEGRWTEAEAIADTIRETRRYAKRQLTWFRKEPGARWHAPPYSLV